MNSEQHRVLVHTSSVQGIEAVSLCTNHAFPRHSHDEFGVGVVRAGAQHSWSGIGSVEAYPGDVISCNPNEIHDGIPIGGSARHWDMLFIDAAIVAHHSVHLCDSVEEFTAPALSSPALRLQFDKLLSCVTGCFNPLKVDEELSQLLELMLLGGRVDALATADNNIDPVIDWIDQDPASSHSLDELASTAGISKYQLIRSFKKQLGITPHAYIVQQRVRLARRLIQAGESLTTAALASGFADQSHLTRSFQKQYAFTPGKSAAAVD